ncbi:C-factor-like [Argiope bruennichi]|uniref:C-factor-like n=1 Tax=Argiope bruennichi TaxID=94029 RepID=UPI0024955427|nr:C-factor-like [Argiope bruennichi]
MKIESVMVTGANRGIGLEFVRQLSQLSDPPQYIFATYRNADSLKDLKEIEESSKKAKIILIKMDVTRSEEIASAKQTVEATVGEKGLNLLINNAGVAQPELFPNITPQNLELHFKVNTEGPIMVLQAMLPILEKAARLKGEGGAMSASRAAVLNMTSMAGSITNTGVVFTEDLAVPSYKTSKAALNMAMKVAAAHAKDKGILVVMMCPGWVKTDMGGKDRAVLEPEDSIAAMIKTLSILNESHHGVYMDRLGNPYQF